MIKSQEQFRQIIFSLAKFERNKSENSIYTMHLEDLIKSLRIVARTAHIRRDELDSEAINDALNAVPAWCLEEN